jgi:hypothetical protein
LESILFTMLVTSPLTIYLRCTGEQLLAGALGEDLQKLKSYLKDIRRKRAEVLGIQTPSLHAATGVDRGLALTGSVRSPFNGNDDDANAPSAPPSDAYIRKSRQMQLASDDVAAFAGESPLASPDPTDQRQSRRPSWSFKKPNDGDMQPQTGRDMI